jgi:hypothetical protein
MALLDLETFVMDRLITLLQTDATLNARQILKANAKTQIALPMLRIQAGTVGPHPQFTGSAMVGVWDVLGWITAIGSRTDGTVDVLRSYIDRARDLIYNQHHNEFSGLNTDVFKVWHIDFEQVTTAQVDEQDAVSLPLRITCAKYMPATT